MYQSILDNITILDDKEIPQINLNAPSRPLKLKSVWCERIRNKVRFFINM